MCFKTVSKRLVSLVPSPEAFLSYFDKDVTIRAVFHLLDLIYLFPSCKNAFSSDLTHPITQGESKVRKKGGLESCDITMSKGHNMGQSMKL